MKTYATIANWTPERVARLTELWAEGLSCSQIAKQLGGATRNAVIGKATRLGLPPRGRTTASLNTRLNHRGLRYQPPAPRKITNNRVYAMPVDQPLPTLRGSATPSEPRPWLTRKFGECAYPVAGEGADTLSCCNPTGEGANYCPAHRKVMFAKPATPAQRAAAAKAREARAKAQRPMRRAA